MYVPLGAAAEPFHTAQAGGVTFNVANDKFRSTFTMSLIGWKVRSSQLLGFGHTDPKIETERTEAVEMTPYTESIGPDDPGDGFRWVDIRREVGRGVIIIPPAGWDPSKDIMHASGGKITAIATEDFAQVKQHCADGKSSFVLVEPAQGWKNIGAEPGAGAGVSNGGPSTESLIIAAGVAVGAAVLLYVVWG
jgi:hypothetical protein